MASNPTRDEAENAAAQWLLRQNEAWSATDQGELEQWLQAFPAHRVAYIRLRGIWRDTGRLRSLRPGFPQGQVPARGTIEQSPFFTLRREPLAVASEIQADPARPSRARYYAAAIAVVALGLGLLAYNGGHLTPGTTYKTDIGGLATVPLADGSQVTLNTNSRIRVALSETERRVELAKGEAFFDVALDARRPFTVVAGRKSIIVMGTKFSVRKEANDVRVVVTEGQVRLLSDAPPPTGKAPAKDRQASPVVLDAGTVVETASGGVKIDAHSVLEAEQLLSWRTGYIVLNETPLPQAIAEFNRYNIRQLSLADASLNTICVGGNFRSNNLDGFLRLLERGFQIDAREVGRNQVRLARK